MQHSTPLEPAAGSTEHPEGAADGTQIPSGILWDVKMSPSRKESHFCIPHLG